MPDNLIPIDHTILKKGSILRALILNAALNTLIAVILTAIGFGRGFTVNLIFSQCIGMAIMLANFAAIPLFKYAKRSFHQVLLVMAAILVGATVGTLLGALANGVNPVNFLREYSAFFIQVVLIGLFFGVLISYVFISLGKISEERAKRLEAEKNAVMTELQLLQSQMEPHFLFNTLSNVLSLIETDQDKARRMLEAFTLFLRTSFLTARNRTVPLQSEMDVVNNYLAVFEVRMGGRLRYRIDIPDELAQFPIPPLLVQPIVENSLKHGLEPLREGGEVSVRANLENRIVTISVADTGVGLRENSSGTGIGLENIRKRLQLAYGEQGHLIIEENEPKGLCVKLELPYEISSNHR
jgi:signal transduction histidine kinase